MKATGYNITVRVEAVNSEGEVVGVAACGGGSAGRPMPSVKLPLVKQEPICII